jgi:prophage regulatory protein
MTDLSQYKIIKRKELLELVSMSKSSLYNHVAENRFPKPIKLAKRSVGWLTSDIQEWFEQKKGERLEAL